MTTPSCPDSSQLLGLLDGELSPADQAELTRHLDGCARCQGLVQDLASGGKSWSDTAAHLSGEHPDREREPALCRAVEELAGSAEPCRTQADRTTGGEASFDPDATRSPTSAVDPLADGLSFLAPTDKPGHLGRLDHYEILEVVGRGGMGIVLKAFDDKLHRIVAVKVLAPQLAVSGNARQRFVREARAAAAVAHDHVVAIHGVAEDGPVPYLIMQFVAGQSLEDRIREGGPLETKELLRIGLQVAAGLAAAHKQGLVHRDVKPGNILLENGVQRVKISDFGLARAVDDASMTQSGVIAGTPMYMSPEQARGEAIDHRSDLFSLGSVLYALATGRPPFRATNTMAVLRRVCDDAPRPVREINPDVPDWLAAIIMKLLAKEPAQRFQTAAEVSELLGQHLAHLQQPHLVARPPSLVTAERAPRRRRQLSLLATAVVLLAGVVVVASHWWSEKERAGRGPDTAQPEGAGLPSPVPGPQNRDGNLAERPEKPSPEAVGVAGPLPFVLPDGDASRMAVSADGKMLAVPCGDKAVVFDAHSGKQLRTGTGHTGRVYCVAFSPDGKRLAGGNWDDREYTVRTWNTETGDAVISRAAHTGNINAVAYSPDGKRLVSASSDGTAWVWNDPLQTDGEALILRGHDGAVYYAVFSPDGKQVVTGGEDRTVRVWDAQTGKAVKTLEGHAQAIAGLAFSPDGQLLASGSEQDLKIWSATDFRELHTAETPAAWLAFAPDSRSLLVAAHNSSGSPDDAHVVRRYDRDGKELAALKLKGKGGWAVYALTPDGKTLFETTIHTDDHALRAYETATGAEVRPVPAGAVP